MLHKLINSYNVKKVEELIQIGYNLNEMSLGETPLTLAINSNCTDIVKLLVDNGCDVNLMNRRKLTPLIIACQNITYINRHIVLLLIEAGCDVNKTDSYNTTPLMIACSRGFVNIAQMLIDAKCKINVYDKGRQSALDKLFYNIYSKRNYDDESEKLAIMLINAGCKVNNSIRNKLITISCNYNYYDLLSLLIKKSYFKRLIKKKYKPPIDRRFNVNGIQKGDSWFMVACKKKHLKIAKLLLDNGCDINYQNSSGNTALIHACYRGQKDVITFLLEAGCDPNIKNNNSNCALFNAFQIFNITMIKHLINYNADINILDQYGDTIAIRYLTSHRWIRLENLITLGCNLNIRNNDGLTFFDYFKNVTVNERDEIVQILNKRFKKSLIEQCILFIRTHKFLYSEEELYQLPFDVRKFLCYKIKIEPLNIN